MCLFPGLILSVAFRPAFDAGASALVIMCVAQAVRNWMGPNDVTLIMTGHQTAAWLCFVIAAPLLLLGPWAAQQYGLVGVTLVVFAASTLARGLQYVAVRLKLGVSAHASLSPRFLLTLLTVGRSPGGPRLAKETCS
jgi:O-antigen/teichoic acid export membrane protein